MISQLSHKTTAETQVLIAQELDLEIKKPTKETRQKDESVRLQVTLSKEQWQKLEKARDLASNATQSNDWATLLEYLSDKLIKQKEGSGRTKITAVVAREAEGQTVPNATSKTKSEPVGQKSLSLNATAAVKRSVIRRDQSCQYKDQSTGKVCGSMWNLHIDHIHPRWAGGNNRKENLRVLCAKHNHHVYRKQAQVKVSSNVDFGMHRKA